MRHIKIGRLSLLAVWLRPSEREGDTRHNDPTRPFCVRASSYTRAGIGGHWGSIALEMSRR